MKVNINDNLYQQVKELANKSGKSIREIVEEAISLFLLGKISSSDKEIKKVTSKIITTLYDTRCARCGKEVKKGELVYWVKIEYEDNTKRSFVYCLDCYYSSSALAEYYLKKKKLELIVKGLKKKADKLVKEIEELKKEYKFYSVLRELKNSIDLIYRYIYEVKEENRPVLNDILDKLNEIMSKLKEIELEVSSNEKKKVIVYERV